MRLAGGMSPVTSWMVVAIDRDGRAMLGRGARSAVQMAGRDGIEKLEEVGERRPAPGPADATVRTGADRLAGAAPAGGMPATRAFRA